MQYLFLIALGLAAGVLGGLLGIGGSILMIPAMAAFLPVLAGHTESLHQYQAAAMITNFLLIGPAVWRHYRAGAIVVRVWKRIVPAALVGVVAGVAVSLVFTRQYERVLRVAFGGFLLYVAGFNVYKVLRPARRPQDYDPHAVRPGAGRSVLVGGGMGFSAGLLGIGGGSLAVPGIQVFVHLPLRNAIATSAAAIFAMAWLGALVKNLTLPADANVWRSLTLAAALAPTAMIGGYLGGHLTHTLPLRAVRGVFVALMLAGAYKMITWGL